MIDQNSQFMAILTAVGEAKQANAAALGLPWTFTQMGVGDANGADPQPSRTQTKLINERRRAPLNQIKVDPKNTNVIIAEQVIPENVGGWWIREIGLYDVDGDLVAVANCAPSFKPLLEQGTGKTQVVRINFIVTSAANVTLKIDPSVVLATRQYVDDRIIEVLPATRKAGTYQQVTVNERGVVIGGTNPDTLAGNGILDAYTKEQIDAGLKLKAPLDSPVLTGLPTAPLAAAGSNNQQLANTAFVQATVAAVISGAPGALDTLKELADALGGDPNFANTVINGLAQCIKAEGGATTAGFAMGDMTVPYIRWGSTPVFLVTQAQLDQKASLLDLALKAPLQSPVLTGVPSGPTPVVGSNNQQLATTAFVQTTVNSVIAGAPGALDTLKELAEALGGDPNFANTIINGLAICLKAEGGATSAGFAGSDATTPYMRSGNFPVYLATKEHLSKKADKGVTLQDYGIAGGKFTYPVDLNMSGQGVGASGFKISNPTLGVAATNLTLVGVNTGVQLLHFNGEQGLYVLEVNSNNPAPIKAGNIISNGSNCHTEASFLKPKVDSWIPLIAGTVLPPGGTWAWFTTNFYDTGRPLNGSTGISPGGIAPATGTSVGFAWRIQ